MHSSTRRARTRAAAAPRSARDVSTIGVLGAGIAVVATVGVGLLAGDVAGMFSQVATVLGH